MATRKLVVFKHDSAMGGAPAHKLFDLVKVSASSTTPRDFGDYKVEVPAQSQMPQGVTVIEKL